LGTLDRSPEDSKRYFGFSIGMNTVLVALTLERAFNNFREPEQGKLEGYVPINSSPSQVMALLITK
jgi:hypothetical protein